MDINKFNTELNNFKKNYVADGKKSQLLSILLFRDYSTKLNLWKTNLNAKKPNIINKKSHNIFLDLSPQWISELKSLDDFNNDLMEIGIEVRRGRFFEDIFIYLYVYWQVFKDTNEIKSMNLPDLYDSLKIILEKTEYIYTIDGYFQIDNITFNDFKKYENFLLPSLENDFLDFLDEKITLDGSLHIPNQQEVNVLWEEFRGLKKNGLKRFINWFRRK